MIQTILLFSLAGYVCSVVGLRITGTPWRGAFLGGVAGVLVVWVMVAGLGV